MQELKIYRAKYYVRFITYIVFTIFIRYYRIKKNLPEEVKRLKSPYLLLSNHVGYWDPFIIGHMLPRFTHFVSSDAAFKNKVAGFFLPRLGTIPKKKNVRDIKVIRDILQVIKQGENVGIFPEGVRNWAGTTLPIDPSIGKLVKLLRVPVIVSVSRGMNLFNPRWSKKLRKTSVTVEYKVLMGPSYIDTHTPQDIYNIICKAIQHDEVKYQRIHKNAIHSNHRSEHINHTLYICPECNAIDTFITRRNDFACQACGYFIHIDKYGFFSTTKNRHLFFDNIRDWYNWQEKWIYNYIKIKYENQDDSLIFEDKGSWVYKIGPNNKFVKIGQADLKLYLDRVEIKYLQGKSFQSLSLDQLKTINPQVNEKLEIFYGDEIYRIVGERSGVSGLKWEVAINAIWKLRGLDYKLSPYIRIEDSH